MKIQNLEKKTNGIFSKIKRGIDSVFRNPKAVISTTLLTLLIGISACDKKEQTTKPVPAIKDTIIKDYVERKATHYIHLKSNIDETKIPMPHCLPDLEAIKVKFNGEQPVELLHDIYGSLWTPTLDLFYKTAVFINGDDTMPKVTGEQLFKAYNRLLDSYITPINSESDEKQKFIFPLFWGWYGRDEKGKQYFQQKFPSFVKIKSKNKEGKEKFADFVNKDHLTKAFENWLESKGTKLDDCIKEYVESLQGCRNYVQDFIKWFDDEIKNGYFLELKDAERKTGKNTVVKGSWKYLDQIRDEYEKLTGRGKADLELNLFKGDKKKTLVFELKNPEKESYESLVERFIDANKKFYVSILIDSAKKGKGWQTPEGNFLQASKINTANDYDLFEAYKRKLAGKDNKIKVKEKLYKIDDLVVTKIEIATPGSKKKNSKDDEILVNEKDRKLLIEGLKELGYKEVDLRGNERDCSHQQ